MNKPVGSSTVPSFGTDSWEWVPDVYLLELKAPWSDLALDIRAVESMLLLETQVGCDGLDDDG